jgi:hypothetical protein
MENFVVATLEDGKPNSFYTSATSSNLELSSSLQAALIFNSKPLARSAMAAYQSQFPDLEVAVLSVEISVSLV